jgi:hypothetical protein
MQEDGREVEHKREERMMMEEKTQDHERETLQAMVEE